MPKLLTQTPDTMSQKKLRHSYITPSFTAKPSPSLGGNRRPQVKRRSQSQSARGSALEAAGGRRRFRAGSPPANGAIKKRRVAARQRGVDTLDVCTNAEFMNDRGRTAHEMSRRYGASHLLFSSFFSCAVPMPLDSLWAPLRALSSFDGVDSHDKMRQPHKRKLHKRTDVTTP